MSLVFRISLAALCGAILVACLPAHGNEPTSAASDDPNIPRAIELSVAPAPEPRPALKYRLVPSLAERTPGNAATYYYRAIVHYKMLPQELSKQHADRSEAWLTKDPAKYPKEEVQKWLQSQQLVLAQIKTAVYRDTCDWDLRVQDLRGMEVISYLLAEFQDARGLARTLQLQAHDQIMAGRYDDAVETLRHGYQLAQDVGRPPLLIAYLIGVAIGHVMNEELTFLIERSDQNYYWAIAALPRPLVDLRPALQCEMNLPNQLFPFLKDAETVERSPDEWRRLIVKCFRELEGYDSGGKSLAGWEGDLAAAALMTKFYPVAKQQLIAGGLDRERVEAMPVGQVVAIHTARVTEYAYHEIFKVSLLPADEAIRRLPEVVKRLGEDLIRPDARVSGRAGLPVASLLLPAMQAVLRAEVRSARNFAALQAIEALRMHAAANQGKLPATLADVTIVPVPNNPATGQPFAYKYDAASSSATLDVPASVGASAKDEARRYVIRMEK